jgi:hypothetical protein
MPMNDSMGDAFEDRSLGAQGTVPAPSRPIGSPLPVGGRGRQAQPHADARRLAQVPPPGRSLPTPAPPSDEQAGNTNLQRAMNALRLAMPFVQKLLPLLDGHVATTVSNILTPHPAQPMQPAPAPQADLVPIEEGLNRLENQQRELRGQVAEQNTSLKRVEDQLEMVREATDRNTLEQQELMEDLKNVGAKVNVVTLVVLSLLLISMLLNLVLYLHIQRVLP